MHRKKPRPASMDEVKISRDRDDAVIEYADKAIGGMNLRIGPEIADMSDRDILALHNEVVSAMQASADAWEDVVIEIPVGREQVAFRPESDQWSPRGDVVRCTWGTRQEALKVLGPMQSEASLKPTRWGSTQGHSNYMRNINNLRP